MGHPVVPICGSVIAHEKLAAYFTTPESFGVKLYCSGQAHQLADWLADKLVSRLVDQSTSRLLD